MDKRPSFTPGPWRLITRGSGLFYVTNDLPEHKKKPWDNPTICLLYEDVTPFDSVTIGDWLEPFPNSEANARLLRSAPELYEALERLLKCPDLNLENLEEETLQAIQQAKEALSQR